MWFILLCRAYSQSKTGFKLQLYNIIWLWTLAVNASIHDGSFTATDRRLVLIDRDFDDAVAELFTEVPWAESLKTKTRSFYKISVDFMQMSNLRPNIWCILRENSIIMTLSLSNFRDVSWRSHLSRWATAELLFGVGQTNEYWKSHTFWRVFSASKFVPTL